MATPLEITFSTDEQVVAQGDVTCMGKMVESLVVEFDQVNVKTSWESSLWIADGVTLLSTRNLKEIVGKD